MSTTTAKPQPSVQAPASDQLEWAIVEYADDRVTQEVAAIIASSGLTMAQLDMEILRIRKVAQFQPLARTAKERSAVGKKLKELSDSVPKKVSQLQAQIDQLQAEQRAEQRKLSDIENQASEIDTAVQKLRDNAPASCKRHREFGIKSLNPLGHKKARLCERLGPLQAFMGLEPGFFTGNDHTGLIHNRKVYAKIAVDAGCENPVTPADRKHDTWVIPGVLIDGDKLQAAKAAVKPQVDELREQINELQATIDAKEAEFGNLLDHYVPQ